MKKSMVIVLLTVLLVLGFQSDLSAKKKKKKLTKAQKRAAKILKQEGKITKYLGTGTNWKPAALKDVRKGMTCGQVARVLTNLSCGDSSPFKKVSAGLLGTVSEYKLYFQNGRLHSVTLIFGPRLFDEKRFATALMNVVQRKWGPITDEADIVWKTHDYEDITLKYNETHWELELEMPSVDPGDIDTESFNEEMLRANLKQILGGRDNCIPAFFAQYKYRMPWQEVKRKHPDLVIDTSQSLNFSTVSLKGHPLIAGLRFRFDSGLLVNMKAIFHWQIPRDMMKQVSFEVMREKYGVDIKDEDVAIDRLAVYTPAKVYVYRQWSTNRWELDMNFPKTGGVPVKAAIAKTPVPKPNTSTVTAGAAPAATAAPAMDITGNWVLVAAKQGDKKESMEDGMGRAIEFTAGMQMKMKEKGKVVMTNYYKLSGKALYFTDSKNGKPVKKFGTVVSHQGNNLSMKFEGQDVEMIFKKS